MNILVPNLGSTSFKYQLREMPPARILFRGKIERVEDYLQAIASLPLDGHAIDAVAFKAVHAGPRYCGTFLIDGGVIAALEDFLPAAPAHNAIYLTAIRAFQDALPGIPLHDSRTRGGVRRATQLARKRNSPLRFSRCIASIRQRARASTSWLPCRSHQAH